jgi:predicted nucleotidyltransferase
MGRGAEHVDSPEIGRVIDDVTEALRRAGADFALVFGSRARGDHHPGSDVDIAAHWPDDPPAPWEIEVPAGCDLIVIDDLPVELAGRIALEGRVILDLDPVARVRWVATTRKLWLDERPRIDRANDDFLASVTRD